jgi:ABC-type uncharacterized transport system ATPase subunit
LAAESSRISGVAVAAFRETVRQLSDRIDLHVDRDQTVEVLLGHAQGSEKILPSLLRGSPSL